MGEYRRRRLLLPSVGGACAVALLAGAVATMVAEERSAAAAGETYVRPADGDWVIEGRGYGHGRGMPQWGSRAAAAGGRSAEQILAFYYPGTRRAAIGDPAIRVRLMAEPDLIVKPARGLTARWPGGSIALPSSRGVDRWRISARGSGLGLRYRDSRGYHRWGPALPSSVQVSSAAAALRVARHDATTVHYRGTLTVSRSGAGTTVVNRLPLQAYLRGVVPRESPASWPVEALRAQSVAARTYAYAKMRRNASSSYDICDTTACQMYGGAARYGTTSGRRISGERSRSNAAVARTAGTVLTYRGVPAVTEFSASNGGVTVASGLPYQVSKADPWTAGDPYRIWTVRVRASTIAARFGLSRLDYVRVTARDGRGAYRGRITSVILAGSRAGKPYSTTVTGNRLRSALGLRSTYFTLRSG